MLVVAAAAAATARRRSRPLLLARALAVQAQAQQEQQRQQRNGITAAAAALAAAVLATTTTALPALADDDNSSRPELARSRGGDPDQSPAATRRADAEMRANAAALRAARLAEWLRRSGADLAAVELAPSPALKKNNGSGGSDPNDDDAEGAGYGVLVGQGLRGRMRASWLGRRLGAALVPGGASVVAARVPLRLAITPEAVASDPLMGPHVQELAQLGLLDGRTAVILALCVHRALGDASPLAAWVDALPRAFEGSPLWWATSSSSSSSSSSGDAEDLAPRLQELRGTTLAAAASAHQRRLSAQWQRLRPAAEAMVEAAAAAAADGVEAGRASNGGSGGGAPSPPRPPTFDDYRWAYAVYWSRAHSLPVPVSEEVVVEEEEQEQRPQEGDGNDNPQPAQQPPRRRRRRRRQTIHIVEGLVPGLDFCNHSLDANAWWEVEGVEVEEEEDKGDNEKGDDATNDNNTNDGASVVLLAHRARLPRPGGELFISYGDKSNEELLLLHGFAAENNPHEAAMLPCPLPSSSGGAGGQQQHGSGSDDDGGWDDVLRARLALLHGMGLAPQLFLTAAHLRELEQDQRRLGWALPSDPLAAAAAASSSSSSSSSSDPATWRLSSARVRALPPGGRETLEAFVVPPEEVAERLRLLDEQGPPGALSASRAAVAAAADPSAPPTARVEALGWAMATLTTFVRLLELRVLALEADDEGTGPLERDLALLTEGEEEEGGEGEQKRRRPLEGWRRACVLYRAGQKRLVRGYLRAARAELQATLAELREAIEAEEREEQQREQGGVGGGLGGAGGEAKVAEAAAAKAAAAPL